MSTDSAEGPKAVYPSPVLPPICGFWVRVLALIIDSLLLSLFGLFLGALYGQYFCDLWPWGRLIGYSIAVAYFAISQSTLGNGQSIGKKILKIRVVNRSGNCISPLRSLARAVLLETPFFLSQQQLPPSISGSLVGSILNFFTLVVGGGTVYLYLFNRRTRQGLHDLAVGTYVRHADATGAVEVPPVAKIHFALFGACCLAALAYTGSLSTWLWQRGEFAEMLALERSLSATNKMYAAGITQGEFYRSGKVSRVLTVSALWRSEPSSYQEAANEVASVVLSTYPRANQVDQIVVRILRGYDIGIAHAWHLQWFASTPAELRARLGIK